MYRHNRVRTRVLREMFDGLATKGISTAEAPAASHPADALKPASQPSSRWWRVGRYFRRSEPAHLPPPVRQ